jgi:hypothetical protein
MVVWIKRYVFSKKKAQHSVPTVRIRYCITELLPVDDESTQLDACVKSRRYYKTPCDAALGCILVPNDLPHREPLAPKV